MLSKKALSVLKQLFAVDSNLQLPVAVAEEAVEIRKWVNEQIAPAPKPAETIVDSKSEEFKK